MFSSLKKVWNLQFLFSADFILLTKNSHVMEVSNQQIVYSENDLKESPMSISLLLDGQLVNN